MARLEVSEALVTTRIAVDQLRLLRAATQHAIQQSRKSVAETTALLLELRMILLAARMNSTSVNHREQAAA